jgi:putative flippase GtrA
MIEKLQHLSPEFRRYLIVGISVYLFELVVIVVAQALGANGVVAVGISFWLGLIVSFAIQKIFTFGDKRRHYKVLVPQIAAFSLLVLFNFSFTVFVAKLLTPAIPAVICRTAALGITTFWNFYLYKTHIFRRQII